MTEEEREKIKTRIFIQLILDELAKKFCESDLVREIIRDGNSNIPSNRTQLPKRD